MRNKREILKEAISLLEHKKAMELNSLKKEAHHVVENLKPLNIFKNALHDVQSSADVKNDLVNDALDLATAYLMNKIKSKLPTFR
jgi:hypothetical protein